MKNYKPPRKYSKPRKYNGKCEQCGEPKAFNEVYCRVDESNIAITHNAPYLCIECYRKEYKVK